MTKDKAALGTECEQMTSTALERAHECEAEREAVEKEACILARLAEQRFVAVADHLPYLVNPRQMSQKAK
jgi:hypothetical protein